MGKENKYIFNDCNVCTNEDIYWEHKKDNFVYFRISFSMNYLGKWNTHLSFGYPSGGASINVNGYTFETKELAIEKAIERTKIYLNKHFDNGFINAALKSLNELNQPEQLKLF